MLDKHHPSFLLSDRSITANVPTPQGKFGLVPVSTRRHPEHPRRDLARDCRHCLQIQKSEDRLGVKGLGIDTQASSDQKNGTTSHLLCLAGTASKGRHRGETEPHTGLETWKRPPPPHRLPRHQCTHPRVCPLNLTGGSNSVPA